MLARESSSLSLATSMWQRAPFRCAAGRLMLSDVTVVDGMKDPNDRRSGKA